MKRCYCLALVLPLLFAVGCNKTPSADEVLQSTADYYKNADSYKVKSTVTTVVSVGGEEQSDQEPIKVEQTLIVKRPNKFMQLVETSGGPLGISTNVRTACDGEKMYVETAMAKTYQELDAPDFNSEPGMAMIGGDPCLGLLCDDWPAMMKKDATSVAVVGLEDVNGQEAYHLKFEITREVMDQEMSATQHLWIATGGKPELLKMMQEGETTITFMGKEQTLASETTVEMTEWEINPELEDEEFLFKPSPGYTKAAGMGEAMKRLQEQLQRGN